jgi:hypothetical protein
MAQQPTDRNRTLMYLRLPFTAIPLFFRKYDAQQATRMSVNVLKDCAREIVGQRVLRWLATVLKTAWYLAGPLSIVFAARLATTAPSVTYGLLWQVFSLAVIGLTLSAHALGKLTLNTNAGSVFRPLATLPVRALLVGILWLPMPLGLSFETSLVFAGTTLAAYLLTAPHFAQWFGLGVLHWGSPRRARLTEALSMPILDEASVERLCAHEAGHALMYGLGDEIPEDLYLYIDRDLVGDGVGGAVLASVEFTPEQAALEQIKFRLMVLAAGAAGERVRLGDMSIAAHADFVSFEALASFYLLSAGYAVIAEPTTALQHQVNATAVSKLREEMIELASRIIRTNRDVHDELVTMLLARSDLAYDDVLPTLSRVKRIPDAPLPTWSKATVTHRLTRQDLPKSPPLRAT